MPILFVVEKRSHAMALMASIHRVDPWPGTKVQMLLVGMGLSSFDIPSGLRSSDFPFVGHVRKSLDVSHALVCTNACGEPSSMQPLAVDIRNAFAEADLVVKATDAGHRGAVSFRDILASFAQEKSPGALRAGSSDGPDIIRDASLRTLDPGVLDALVDALATHTAPAWLPGSAEERRGDARDWFAYNWLVNSGLFSAPLQMSGVASCILHKGREVPAASLLSRNALLVVLAMARGDMASCSARELSQRMEGWQGSGRYGRTAGDLLGSAIGRSETVHALCELGLLDAGARLDVSDRGRMLAAALPKSAYDMDLPFRLDAWCRDWPRSRPAMEAYVMRWFGSVKRTTGMMQLLADGGLDAPAIQELAARHGAMTIACQAQVSMDVVLAASRGEVVSPAQGRALSLAAARLKGATA